MKAIASPNIALIKYWGKLPASRDEDRNIGTNPSLSMTLSNAKTTVETHVLSPTRGVPDGDFEFFVAGKAASEQDQAKLLAHIRRVEAATGAKLPALRVDSRNNFPLGAGIASSASSFAALTLAFVGEALGLDEANRRLQKNPAFFSSLARRGSGSASRSIYPGFAKWDGEAAHGLDVDWHLRDTIVIFSGEKKKTSSSDGHQAALTSPDFAARLKRLPARLAAVENALRERSLAKLGPLIEEEALEMHAITRTGSPAIDYLLPQTRRFLEAMGPAHERDFHFTIDAGPNLHILSERPIAGDLLKLLQASGIEAEIWEDEYGFGPVLQVG